MSRDPCWSHIKLLFARLLIQGAGIQEKIQSKLAGLIRIDTNPRLILHAEGVRGVVNYVYNSNIMEAASP